MPKIKSDEPSDAESRPPESIEEGDFESLKPITPPVKELGPGAKRRRAARLPLGPDATEQEQEAEAIRVAESRKLPKLPGFRPTWEQAEAYVQALTPVQWARLFAYVWRRKPVIIREPKYIDVLSEQRDFRRDYIKEMHGGGKYRIGLQDTETRANKNVMIMDISLDIPLTETDPKLDYTELDLGDKMNKTYVEKLRARGILDMDGNEITRKPQAEASETGPLVGLVKEVLGQMSKMQVAQVQEAVSRRGRDPEGQVLETTIAMLGKASDAREKMLMDRMKDQDPSSVLDMVDKIANRIAPKSDANSDLLKHLLATQESDRKLQMSLMEKLIETGSRGDDEAKTLEKIKMYKDIFSPMFGSGGKRPWHEGLFEALPHILEHGSNIVGNIVAARMKGPMMPPAATPSPPPIGGGENAPVPLVAEPSEQPHVDPNEFVGSYGGLILNAVSQGTTGDAFAEYVVGLFGMNIYSIATNIGKNNLLAAMRNNPEFMQHANPIWPQMETFVDEFLAFGNEADAESPPPMGEEGKSTELGETQE